MERCTDLVPGDRPDRKSPWIERKRRFLAQIRGADRRSRLVVACDKLHNLRNVVCDLRLAGIDSLERFSASPAQTRWYFEAVRSALGDDLPRALLAEVDALLVELARHVPESSEGLVLGVCAVEKNPHDGDAESLPKLAPAPLRAQELEQTQE